MVVDSKELELNNEELDDKKDLQQLVSNSGHKTDTKSTSLDVVGSNMSGGTGDEYSWAHGDTMGAQGDLRAVKKQEQVVHN